MAPSVGGGHHDRSVLGPRCAVSDDGRRSGIAAILECCHRGVVLLALAHGTHLPESNLHLVDGISETIRQPTLPASSSDTEALKPEAYFTVSSTWP